MVASPAGLLCSGECGDCQASAGSAVVAGFSAELLRAWIRSLFLVF